MTDALHVIPMNMVITIFICTFVLFFMESVLGFTYLKPFLLAATVAIVRFDFFANSDQVYFSFIKKKKHMIA